MGAIFTSLYMVGLWLQGSACEYPGGVSKRWHIKASVRTTLSFSCSKENVLVSSGSLLHPQRDRASQPSFVQGWLRGCEATCAARRARGCPSEQGPCTPGGCVLGQGLCRLPGSALSLPGELLTALWGEAVGGRSHPQQGRVLLLPRGCCVAQGRSQLRVTPRTFWRGVLRGRSRWGLPERGGVCA